MNELMIVLQKDGGWIYFPTNKTTSAEALEEFYVVCRKASINIDNLHVQRCVLRDESYDDIDEMEVEE